MFIEVLKKEEPLLFSISISPGIIDTDMQALIRNKGSLSMDKDSLDFLVKRYENHELVDPNLPAFKITRFAEPKNQRPELNGKFFYWDDKELNFIV